MRVCVCVCVCVRVFVCICVCVCVRACKQMNIDMMISPGSPIVVCAKVLTNPSTVFPVPMLAISSIGNTAMYATCTQDSSMRSVRDDGTVKIQHDACCDDVIEWISSMTVITCRNARIDDDQ